MAKSFCRRVAMETKVTAIFFNVIGIVTPVLFCDALPTVAIQPGVKGAITSSQLSNSNGSSIIGRPKHPEFPTYELVGQTSESVGSTRGQLPPKPHFSLRPPLQSSRDRYGPFRSVPNERAKGRGSGGGGGGGGRGGGRGGDWIGEMKPRLPVVRPDAETYYLLFGRRLENGLKKNGRKQQVMIDSRFSLNLQPLAMAEYLLLTDDFTGFEEAMADIVAIGMMSPWEAEIYRQEVGIEYQSLVKQETEAELANLYGKYKEKSPSLVDEMFRSPGFSPFAPVVQYPDSGYYGNQNADVIFDREPPSSVGAMNGETAELPPSEYLGELLQVMADDSSGRNKDEGNGAMDEVNKTQSTPSTVSPVEQSVKQGGGGGGGGGGKGEKGRGEKGIGGEKGGGKAGKAGGKNGSGKGDRRKARSKGKGRKSGAVEKGRPSSSSSSSSSVSKDAAQEVLTLTQNKTKEANGTKTRRPLSKQPVISNV